MELDEDYSIYKRGWTQLRKMIGAKRSSSKRNERILRQGKRTEPVTEKELSIHVEKDNRLFLVAGPVVSR